MAPVDVPTLTDAGGTVEYLQEISPEMRGCAILSADDEVLASTGMPLLDCFGRTHANPPVRKRVLQGA